MKTRALVISVLTILLAVSALAQETYFGKNKVQYKNFEWSYIQTRHFESTSTKMPNRPPNSRDCSRKKRPTTRTSREIDYKQQNASRFLYNRTTLPRIPISSRSVPEGVGGFMRPSRSDCRAVRPFLQTFATSSSR
jgi:hypothetical protein